MKKGWKLIAETGLVLGLCVLLAALLHSGRTRRMQLTCSRLEVCVADSLDNPFISRTEIRRLLDRQYGAYIGQRVDSVGLARIERLVASLPAVRHCDAYLTPDAVLHVDIRQRTPVVRYLGARDCYSDTEGFLFDGRGTPARVPVIEGDVPFGDSTWMARSLALVRHLEHDRDWAGRFGQIHVAKDGSLELIPRHDGTHFLFGKPERIADKLDRIRDYYRFVLPAARADSIHYRTVNVDFDGQIVCRK